ncbi:methenyltetrahydromethanopterin cyclohydrolase [Rivibacter subsaxonicus]|uniref:Methenyltetrahydromethanopterin cyclohydrolase n=1 Tax=Rivibacter subsaxonicus TaxID=457575 RepID=A0A4V2FUN3_9BURK|nr:methenyltetrahydromethanopterin cyclohydrolase [Rivibacter subsaxonicus]RZU02726.1 methenyltetrahydromethanopterin cyclohydrolase [Rivibacter subsaxonicus]
MNIATHSATPSLNTLAAPLVDALVADAELLRLKVFEGPRGVRIVDAGIEATGSVEAGLAVARICMAGLGRISLRHETAAFWPSWIDVSSSQPVLACLASQYAGWSLSASKEETGGKKFFALGSGPARALAGKEALFEELGYRDRAGSGCLVLEVDRPPPEVIVDKLLRDCGLAPAQLTLVLTPTRSLAGTTQIVARVLETALHKAHELKFPLAQIAEGAASAPLPPPAADGLEAMGRTNDAILYGGRVHLTVDADDDAAKALAQALPSCNAKEHGKGFAEVFAAAGFDFYKIDGALFAPAEAWVSSLQSGRTHHAGRLEPALLRRAWMAES